MNFSERIKERRTAKGMTQKEVADIIGVDTTTYAHYESGRRMPDIYRLRSLCQLFEISVEEHFPIVRKLKFPDELICNLSAELERINRELSVINYSDSSETLLKSKTEYELYKKLKRAIEPLQKIWENVMDAPQMDLNGLVEDQVIMRVDFNPQEMKLLYDSIELQAKLAEALFG